MRTLPPAQLPTAILSFDFDGTLHDPAANHPVPAAFFDLVRQLREDRQILWGINTGRSMAHLLEGFVESRFPFLPDWVVAREREIYTPNSFGRWLPHQEWNKRCEKEIHKLFKSSRKLLGRIRQEVEEHTGAQWMEMEGEPAGLISRTEEEMSWIIEHITPLVVEAPRLGWQRNSIYLRFGHQDFQKGSSLGEIARMHRLPAARCFAMGDSHNDLEMLDPSHAGMTACPANSVAEIRERVTANGGIVTREVHGAGVVEAPNHYFGESAD